MHKTSGRVEDCGRPVRWLATALESHVRRQSDDRKRKAIELRTQLNESRCAAIGSEPPRLEIVLRSGFLVCTI